MREFRSVVVGVVVAGFLLATPLFAAPNIPCKGIKFSRVVIGHESKYESVDGIKKEEEQGFTVDSEPSTSSCSFELKVGQCLIIEAKKSDVGDLSSTKYKWQCMLEGSDEEYLRGKTNGGVYGGALIGRCPHDNGFGCTDQTWSDRAGSYEQRLIDKGLSGKTYCAFPVNEYDKASGKKVWCHLYDEEAKNSVFQFAYKGGGEKAAKGSINGGNCDKPGSACGGVGSAAGGALGGALKGLFKK